MKKREIKVKEIAKWKLKKKEKLKSNKIKTKMKKIGFSLVMSESIKSLLLRGNKNFKRNK